MVFQRNLYGIESSFAYRSNCVLKTSCSSEEYVVETRPQNFVDIKLYLHLYWARVNDDGEHLGRCPHYWLDMMYDFFE